MCVKETAAVLGLSTLELFRTAQQLYPDPWAPNPDLNHTRWSLWGDAFIPDSVKSLAETSRLG